ncbi:MAG: hypothetical protein V3W37_04465 [Candidatus Binatia bacterium]
MTSERCLSLRDLKADASVDQQTIFSNADARPVCVQRTGRLARDSLEIHS